MQGRRLVLGVLMAYLLWTQHTTTEPTLGTWTMWYTPEIFQTLEACLQKKHDHLIGNRIAADVMEKETVEKRKGPHRDPPYPKWGRLKSMAVIADTIKWSYEHATTTQHLYCLPETIDPRKADEK
jgi:hypothetical protein